MVVLGSTLAPMKKRDTESVRIKKSLLDKVRKNKEKTGVNISRFIETLIEKALK